MNVDLTPKVIGKPDLININFMMNDEQFLMTVRFSEFLREVKSDRSVLVLRIKILREFAPRLSLTFCKYMIDYLVKNIWK